MGLTGGCEVRVEAASIDDTSDVHIQTPRLVLNEFQEQDTVSLHSYRSDSEVSLYLPNGPIKMVDAEEYVRTSISSRYVNPRRRFRLTVSKRESRTIVGDCVIRTHDPNNTDALSRLIGQAYIGYYLNKKFWARDSLLSFGFDGLGLNRMWAWCDPENRSSLRVLNKIGMTKETEFRKSVLTQGVWRDCFVYCNNSASCLGQSRRI